MTVNAVMLDKIDAAIKAALNPVFSILPNIVVSYFAPLFSWYVI